MKKTRIYLLLLAVMALAATGCQNDETDFSKYINGGGTEEITDKVTTISIVYNGLTASATGDTEGYVTISGADVTVNTGTATDSLVLVVSGQTNDGSLLVWRERKYRIRLNGVTMTNMNGPAINNQCGKMLYLEVVDGTTNLLSDGTAYDETDAYQQKGALFSEGQICLIGKGQLTVTGTTKNAIACDDYMIIDDSLTLIATSTTGNGIKVNEGIWINSGTLDISVTANGARGIRCDSVMVINGGDITIKTTGNCVYDEEESDYSSAACIKCDCRFTMTGGSLTMTSSGDGGKGINCAADVVFSGGTLVSSTTGGNDDGKPKAVKGDKGIIVKGGSFTASVKKSWACDNGYSSEDESDQAAHCVTVEGAPSTKILTKKSVKIKY